MTHPTVAQGQSTVGARAGSAGAETAQLDALRAAALAYRKTMGEQHGDGPARAAAEAAWRAAGGDPRADLALLLAEISGRYSAWFWAPAARRIAWEEHCLRQAGLYPPPHDRSRWPPIPPVPDGWTAGEESGPA